MVIKLDMKKITGTTTNSDARSVCGC